MIITIDGYVATGKSTVAKKLAQEIGFIYFDTGAMYRTVTLGFIEDNVNPEDPQAVKAYLDKFTFDIKIKYGTQQYLLHEKDVTDEIRKPHVTAFVSQVSALPQVREKLTEIQRELSLGVNAVFEGRDMGTTVFPEASLKIFLTGRPEVRAKRRFDELKAKFPKEAADITLENALENLTRRDEYDSNRTHSPLRQAEDAHLIDTSDLNVDEIVFQILELRDSLRANET